VLLAAFAAAQPLHEGKTALFPRQRSAVAAESTHSYDVRHYRIDLATTLTSGAMTARCRIALTPLVGGFDTFSLHFTSLVCDSVKRAGNACTFTTPSGRLLVDLDRAFAAGESLEVDIWYHRNSGTSNRGYYYYSRGSSGIPHAVAYTVTETDDSRYWFPCFDQPWDKAERGCEINLTVPDSMSACANGTLDSVTTGAGTKTYWWTHRYPIPTYLMCFAASKFTDWQVWWTHGAESTAVRYYVWPEDSVQGASSFSRMTDMLTFFSQPDMYGMYPYADEKYGMVAVYPYPWGGMEHTTMTTIHRQWVTSGSVNGIAHELAHQWWGDMVTCLDWRNIVLNEGYATYSDELYEEHYRGRSAFLSMIQSRAQSYFQSDSRGRRPLYDPPPGEEFDWGYTYCKGAWLMHMLRYVIGDTGSTRGPFFAAVRAYGDSFRMGSADFADMERVFEGSTGLDLGWFFDEWVFRAGYPNYSARWYGRETGDGWEAVVDLSQNNGSGAPAVFRTPVEVRVNYSGGSQTFRYEVAASPQRNVFSVPAQPTSVEFDPNDWVLDKHTVTVGLAEEAEAARGITRAAVELRSGNPARGAVRLGVALPTRTAAALEVFDAQGRLVRTLNSGELGAGRHSFTWDRRDGSGRVSGAGVYVARLVAGGEQAAVKLVLAD
ncbi:MAG: M1 family aminopeptidase, partial [bacterium]